VISYNKITRRRYLTTNRTKAISYNKIIQRQYLTTKSHKDDISQQNCTNAISYNKIARKRYLTTKSHKGNISQQNRAKAVSYNKIARRRYLTIATTMMIGALIHYRCNPIRVSSSKIISHSLRPILIEGEYCILTNDLRIRGEIAPGAPDKICVAFFFTEPFS
jgi:hypothetical protein